MILIVDTNIIFAGLLKDGKTRKLLIHSSFLLYAPENILKEIQKYKERIRKRAGFSEVEFELLFALLTENITIIEKKKYDHTLPIAAQLITDKGDIPFLALALSMPNHGIWTENVKHYRQDTIKIWTTTQLLHKENL